MEVKVVSGYTQLENLLKSDGAEADIQVQLLPLMCFSELG